MLENAIYSVISPEGCATILWRDPKKTLEAAKSMKLTSKELLDLEIIDEVIPEPLGGAHRDKEIILYNVRASISSNLENYKNMSREEIFLQRKNKFLEIGRKKGFTKNSEIKDSLALETSFLKKIKNKINKKTKVYFISISILVIALVLVLIL